MGRVGSESLFDLIPASIRLLTDHSKRTLTNSIKQRARLEGFDKVGVVCAEALETEGELLSEWLKRGYHGEMAWMQRNLEKRVDPRKLFPATRSLVVVALNYFTSPQHSDNSSTGKVSRYAWGDDYHNVMGEKLRSLLEWIKEQAPETEGKVCVDIQPVMDKAWAVRAGLGWLGKHTNVITLEFGSWVFIGELLLNLELASDEDGIEDHCGTCTLCIDACPTQAITEPYVVDSTKCISYGTIELRSPQLPEVIEGNLSGWLYGCDICQDVCPWNRFEKPTKETAFKPRLGETSLAIEDIAAMDHSQYVERFRGSSMKRTKLSGLKRNAAALRSDDKL